MHMCTPMWNTYICMRWDAGALAAKCCTQCSGGDYCTDGHATCGRSTCRKHEALCTCRVKHANAIIVGHHLQLPADALSCDCWTESKHGHMLLSLTCSLNLKTSCDHWAVSEHGVALGCSHRHTNARSMPPKGSHINPQGGMGWSSWAWQGLCYSLPEH